MKNIYNAVILSATLLVMFSGCVVREFPEDGGVDPTEIAVTIYVPENDFSDIVKDYYDSSRALAEGGVLQYIIELTPTQGETIRTVHEVESLPVGGIRVEVMAKALKYTVKGWLQHSYAEGAYFDTVDLSNVTKLAEKHNTDINKIDAFAGCNELDLTGYGDVWYGKTEHRLPLERPYAKFRVVAIDYADYLERVNNGDITVTDIPAYSKVYYTCAIPMGFDVVNDVPVMLTEGFSFSDPCTFPQTGEAQLMSDYVFIDGKESAVSLNIDLYDENDVLIAKLQATKDNPIPLKRGCLTTVKVKLLADGENGSIITIDPEYDDDIEIVLPN